MALTEGTYLGDWLKWEQDSHFSRTQIVVVSGEGALKSGTVLGKVTASGKYAAYDNTDNDGSEAAAGILVADVDATSADVAAVAVVRDAEIATGSLTWHANNNAAAITAGLADLAALNIIAREAA